MAKKTIHLIGSAHLDPVWLWDWREGLNEGIITCKTVLDLLDEYPNATFIRGEASIYEHIERAAPEVFERIAAHVKTGRWDVVGGTYVQPDTNMPATETFNRHFTRGQNYFQSRFGKKVEVGWSADSFGHAAGLPEILAAAGIKGYAFTRPGRFEHSGPFWWYGPGGARVLGYRPEVGGYGGERTGLLRHLDMALETLGKLSYDNMAVFYGLVNHGGGPTRRHLADIAEWTAAHPEVNVVFSGLHRLIASFYAEAALRGDSIYPSYQGEANYCQRGCYASVARFKFPYRRLEATTVRTERSAAILDAMIGGKMNKHLPLAKAWDAILFNSFHDILPGSSIERAYDDQIGWIGGALYKTQQVELDTINKLAEKVDTSVRAAEGDFPTGVALLVWNPHPFAVRAPVELEGSIDYRPVWKYRDRPWELPFELIAPDGNVAPAQRIHIEGLTSAGQYWRLRVATVADLPAFGWAAYELAYRENPAPTPAPASKASLAPAPGVIDNGIYRISAAPGRTGINILRNGKALLAGEGLGAITVEDNFGSWGEMSENPDLIDMNDLREKWTIQRVETLESGPVRATLWVRLTAGSSTLDLTISLATGRDAVDVGARLLLDERSARVKLVMPVAGSSVAVYDVPGTTVTRADEGEVPGGRWVRVKSSEGDFGFASDSLYGFNFKPGVLQATIARASRYAATDSLDRHEEIWAPAVDRGEIKFKFLLAPGDSQLATLAQVLDQPPIVQLVLASPGNLGRSGSLGRLDPADVALLALKPSEDGQDLVVRVQNQGASDREVVLTLGETSIALGNAAPGRIITWKLKREGASWEVALADSLA